MLDFPSGSISAHALEVIGLFVGNAGLLIWAAAMVVRFITEPPPGSDEQSVIEIAEPDRDGHYWALLRDHAIHCLIMAVVALSLAEFLELTA